jgi:predicted transcriptional regulator
MPHEQRRRPNYANDWSVLALLLDEDEQRPWSIQEIIRAIGSATIVADAIANLDAAGLVHRTRDNFVFVTHAAADYRDIVE